MHKKFFISGFLVLLAVSQVFAQSKTVSVNDLYKDYTFRAKGLRAIESMNDGLHYTTLEKGKQINQYEYATGKLVSTLLDIDKIEKSAVGTIEGYSFAPDESKILLYTNSKSVYRHSFVADYYIYDFRSREL
ncbi:MAG: DPP IV N-terminal domain-containing protein, partial [Breznakibacter sp.]|nr:DPP IV N-terminal domain-containing protein [Breznakibacter sp.]